MSRGSNFRKPVPDVDPLRLLQVMDNYVKIKGVDNAFLLGPYEQITKSQAAYGPGLAKNADLLEALLSVAPAGKLKPLVLRRHLMTLASKYKFMSFSCPEVAKVLVRHKADCIMAMLQHLRRLRLSSARVREMKHKAVHEDILAVEQLCQLLELPNAPAFDSASHWAQACLHHQQVRPLKRKASTTCRTGHTATELTTKSAYDTAFAIIASMQLSASSKSHRLDVSHSAAHMKIDVAHSQVAPNAAPKTKPIAKSRRPTAATIRSPASATFAGDCAVAWISSSLGKMYITRAASSSFIRIKMGKGRYKVVVTISDPKCPNHKVVISELAAWIVQHPNLTMEQLHLKKDKLVAASHVTM